MPTEPPPSTIDASLGVGMVGGVKAVILLFALILLAGGAARQAPPAPFEATPTADHHDGVPPEGHGNHNEHHGHHHQSPPLLEMLPPIGPIGFVLMGVDLIFGKKKMPMGNQRPLNRTAGQTVHKTPSRQPPNAPPAAPPLTPVLAWVWSVA